MRNMIVKYTFLFFAFVTFVSGFQVEEFLNKGNEYYKSSDFQNAIVSYEQVLKQGYESSTLYYNLANANYRSSNIGKAVLYYEKALKLDPNNEDAKFNLSIANAATIDKIKDVPEMLLTRWWNSLATMFTIPTWATVVVLLFVIFLVLLGFYLLTKSPDIQRYSFIFGSFFLVLLFFAAIFFVTSINKESSSEYGVLVEKVVTVKNSPDSKSSDSFIIHEGVKFLVEDQIQGWSKIKLADGKIGWVPTSLFEKI